MTAFECYQIYLAIKNHFTKKQYNYIKYNGKVKANIESFHKRKDRFWFERLSRKKTKQEIIQFFVANFTMSDDPCKLWIGEIIKNGQGMYVGWKRKLQSLTYIFKTDIENLLSNNTLSQVLYSNKNTHSILIKEYLKKNINIETLIILNQIVDFKSIYDQNLIDPIWKSMSFLIDKYGIFLTLDIEKYKTILNSINARA